MAKNTAGNLRRVDAANCRKVAIGLTDQSARDHLERLAAKMDVEADASDAADLETAAVTAARKSARLVPATES